GFARGILPGIGGEHYRRLPGGAEADSHFHARAQRSGEAGIEAGGQSVRAVTNSHFFAELEGGIVGQPHATVGRTVRAKLSLANQQRGDGGGIEMTRWQPLGNEAAGLGAAFVAELTGG